MASGSFNESITLQRPPVIHPPRSVTISLKDDIKKELDAMAKYGIITKVEVGEPTS